MKPIRFNLVTGENVIKKPFSINCINSANSKYDKLNEENEIYRTKIKGISVSENYVNSCIKKLILT